MMPNSKLKTTIRQTWRDETIDDVRISRQRLAIRLTFTAMTIALAAILVYLLFTPLFHPKTKLYFLTASAGQQIDVAPLAFFRDDAIKFLSSDGSFQPSDASGEFFLLESPEKAREALTRIAGSAVDRSDVLLIHLCAYPIMSDGRPFLRCDNFSPTNAAQGILPLEDVFNLLGDTSAGSVIVLLDTGRDSGTAPTAEGDGDSDFLTAARELIRVRTSDTLWVITANGPGEHSHRSLRRQGSIFLQSVSDALSGDADLNGDRLIGLDEFYSYVASATTAMVAKESAGAAQQTPLLLKSQNANGKQLQRHILGTAPARGNLIGSLVSSYNKGVAPNVGSTSAADSTPPTPEQAQAEAEKEQAAKSALTVTLEKKAGDAKDSAIEELSENIDLLPAFLADRVKRSIGLTADPSRVDNPDGLAKPDATQKSNNANGTAPEGTTASTPSTDATTSSALGKDEVPTDQIPRSLPDLSRLGNADQTPTQLIQLAWQFTDYLENSPASACHPIDQAPHAWAAWLAYLHGLEEANRTSAIIDPEKLRVELTAEIVAAYQLAAQQKVTAGMWLKRVGDQLPAFEIPNQWITSVALAESIAIGGGPALSARLNQQIQQLDASLTTSDRKQFDEWLKQATSAELNQYAEFFYAQLIGAQSNVPWSLIQQTLTSRRQFERLTADPLSCNSFVADALDPCRRELLEATRCMIDQIAPRWPQKSEAILQRCQQSLQLAQQIRDNIHQAVTLKNQLLINLPHIMQWRSVATEHLGNREIDQDVDNLLLGLEKLNRDLANLDTLNPGELRFQTRQLSHWQSRIEQTWRQTAQALLDGRSNTSASPDWTLDALLSTALIREPLRNRLLTLKRNADDQSQAASFTPGIQPALSSSFGSSAKTDQLQQKQKVLQARWMSLIQWQGAWQKFATDLSPTIQALEKQIDRDLASRLNTLRRADMMLRMLGASEGARYDGQTIERDLHQLQLLFAARTVMRQREADFPDALPDETLWLRAQHEQMNQLISRLSMNQSATNRELKLPANYVTRVIAGGTKSISLVADPAAQAEVSWRNVGAALDEVWLVVDYDPDLIDIESDDTAAFYRAPSLPKSFDQFVQTAEQELVSALNLESQNGDTLPTQAAQKRLQAAKASQMYPTWPNSAVLRPSAGLAAGLAAGKELRIPLSGTSCWARLGPYKNCMEVDQRKRVRSTRDLDPVA